MKKQINKKLISLRILKGGVGTQTSPDDLDQDQLKVGILVLKLHTNNVDVATLIAIDHLTLHPLYYTKLIKAGLVDETRALTLARKLGLLQPKKDKLLTAPKLLPKDEEYPKELLPKTKKNLSVGRLLTRKEILADISALIVMLMKQDNHTLKLSWNNVMSMYKTHGIAKSERLMILNKVKRVLILKKRRTI